MLKDRTGRMLALALSLLLLALAGCQTVKGFGKDLETLGDKIQKN